MSILSFLLSSIRDILRDNKEGIIIKTVDKKVRIKAGNAMPVCKISLKDRVASDMINN